MVEPAQKIEQARLYASGMPPRLDHLTATRLYIATVQQQQLGTQHAARLLAKIGVPLELALRVLTRTRERRE